MIAISVPDIENVTTWRSVAVTTPIAVWFSSAVNVELDVNTGEVVSTTLTILDADPELPAASVAV